MHKFLSGKYNAFENVKPCSHMRRAVVERRQTDFDIPAPLPRVFSHTRSGRGQICHFLRTRMVWSARFRSGRGKLVVGPICCGANFVPAPPPLLDRACVNACDDLCWSQFSACFRAPPFFFRSRTLFLRHVILLRLSSYLIAQIILRIST